MERERIRKTLRAGDYVLRGLKVGDTDDLYQILSDRESTMWFEWHHPIRKYKEVKSFVKRHSFYDSGWFGYGEGDGEDMVCTHFKDYELAVTFHDRLIGYIGVSKYFEDKRAVLHYIMNKKWRCRGAMTAAVKSMCKDIFDDGNTQTIQIEALDINVPSCRVAEKCGFRMTDKTSIFCYMDHDFKIFELTKQDFKSLASNTEKAA